MQTKSQVTVRYKGRRNFQRPSDTDQPKLELKEKATYASVAAKKYDNEHTIRSPFGNALGVKKALATMQEDMDRISRKPKRD